MPDLPSSPNPYEPAAEHARLVAWARECGRADAVKHQEDMLARELPFAAEVGRLGERRLALLAERRVQLLSAADGRAGLAELDRARAATELDAARHALVAAGVDEREVGLPPLERPPDLWPLVGALVVGSVMAMGSAAFGVLGPGSSTTRGVTMACCFAIAAAVVVAALRARGSPPEEIRIAALRRAAAAASDALKTAEARCAGAELETRTADERAVALAAAERRLPAELLGAYCSALVAALPPGALADGAAIDDQPDPTPAAPDWA